MRHVSPVAAPNRVLHLIDLANLALLSGPGEAGRALREYRLLVPVGTGDHIVIAAPPAVAFDAKRAWPNARVVVRRGPIDGFLTGDFTPDRYRGLYRQVVIGSGDGSLAPWVSQVSVPVTVVSHLDRLSHRLMVAAQAVVALGSPPPHGGCRVGHALTPHPPTRRLGRRRWPRPRYRARAGVPC